MDILLDTHVLIWYTEGDEALSTNAVSIIENPNNNVYISVISFFEIAIKIKIGKLVLCKSFDDLFKQTSKAKINTIPVTQYDLSQYLDIPLHPQHKDPFDRLIIATAITRGLSIISVDKNFSIYNDFLDI